MNRNDVQYNRSWKQCQLAVVHPSVMSQNVSYVCVSELRGVWWDMCSREMITCLINVTFLPFSHPPINNFPLKLLGGHPWLMFCSISRFVSSDKALGMSEADKVDTLSFCHSSDSLTYSIVRTIKQLQAQQLQTKHRQQAQTGFLSVSSLLMAYLTLSDHLGCFGIVRLFKRICRPHVCFNHCLNFHFVPVSYIAHC